jgi:hypothetical protein
VVPRESVDSDQQAQASVGDRVITAATATWL